MSHALLSMKFPPFDADLAANFERLVFTPCNQLTYRSDLSNKATVTIAESSQWIRTHQALLTFELVPYTNDAGGLEVEAKNCKSSRQGATRAIAEMNLLIGGKTVESVNPYDDVLAHELSTVPEDQASGLTIMQGFEDPDFFKNGRRKVFLPIWSGLFLLAQALCLPMLSNGGIQLEIVWRGADNLFLNGTVKRFRVEGLGLLWQAISPNPSTTGSLVASTKGGRPGNLTTQRLHVFQSSGNSLMHQQIIATLRPKRSIVSVDVWAYDEAEYVENSKDKYLRFKPFGLRKWRIESGPNIRVPAVGDITHGDSDPSTVVTMLMSQSSSVHNMFSGMKLREDWIHQHFRLSMDFQSHRELFGSGLNLLSASHPYLTIFTEHNAPVSPNTRLVCVVVTDELLTFANDQVLVTETAF
ncbi:hypothetical protein HK097_008404 [Rhizophlyctis rosea]|uniref:Uncharacterized protein n=1 Tax=Rhizophlyctis rosea TaxID=64517 RepID=A0AAD5X4J8_9FUNG|nr:hypothetical protein HK097_008404 [Rhizophlyctis rosea]